MGISWLRPATLLPALHAALTLLPLLFHAKLLQQLVPQLGSAAHPHALHAEAFENDSTHMQSHKRASSTHRMSTEQHRQT
jgi:hypothetical protein